MRTLFTLILVIAGSLEISAAKIAKTEFNLKLYITSDHLIVSAMRGFLPAQSFTRTENKFILYSDNAELQDMNIGLYDLNGDLLLTSYGDYGNKSNLMAGDTIYRLNDFVRNVIVPIEFGSISVVEKPISVADYLRFTLTKIRGRYHGYIDSNRIEIIVVPKMSNPKMVDEAISVITDLNFRVSVRRKRFPDGDKNIQRKLEMFEAAKAFATGCCLDDSTSKALEDLLKHK